MFRKMHEPLGAQMGGVIIYDRVCVGAVSTSSILSCDKSPSSLADGSLGDGTYDS